MATSTLGASTSKKIFNSDIALAVGVVGILVVMVVPLPSWILDILFAISILFAVLILFVSLNTIEPLDFSIFPSVLLISTLFRLSLNVASTRLILTAGHQGDAAAGKIIQAFGVILIGGSYIIGIIIFLILVLINFIVITKGAGRIAEVAARFTLDAMPGKQMAIDADLNAGIIDETVAQVRRKTIQREADFFGAMDGASKFVRGDAIAGLLITAINIVGGLVIGVLVNDMQVQQAATAYTSLTVGDGLIGQIPALIISIAAGITVSKAGAENRLGADFTSQLLQNTKALIMASGTMFLFGIVLRGAGLPFFLLGIVFGFIAWNSHKTKENEIQDQEELQTRQEEEETAEASEDIASLLPIDTLGLELGYALIPLVDTEQDGELLERVKAIRRQIAQDLGFVVPPLHIKDNLQLEPGYYSIVIKGIEVSRGEMMIDHFLAMKAGDVVEELDGIAAVEPAFGLPALWVARADRERAEIAGYTVVDIPTVISTHITEIIKNHAHEFLGRQEVQKLLDNVGKAEPKLVEELIPEMISLGVLQKILQNLLKENVSIRDLQTILEAISDTAAFSKDPEILGEYVRQSLARNITRQYQNEEGVLPVMTLDPMIENTILEAIQETPQGSYLGLDPSIAQQILSAIELGIEPFSMFNYQPLILCLPNVRIHLRKLIERFIPNLVILSHNEVAHDVRIESLGVIDMSQVQQ